MLDSDATDCSFGAYPIYPECSSPDFMVLSLAGLPVKINDWLFEIYPRRDIDYYPNPVIDRIREKIAVTNSLLLRPTE